MSRVVALIDGEHYPPVVRFALARLAEQHDVVAAAFIGGTEKVEPHLAEDTYGVPVVRGADARDSLVLAIARHAPELVVDLSDEPIVSSSDRFELASVALAAGAAYLGADFRFDPPRPACIPATPSLAIIGTGKRVGKTAVSAFAARSLKAAGRDIVVLAMGRGGPAEPELIHGEQVRLTTEDLLALARQGKHASSDNYEDAVMSRITTVGTRRCGGGMAGTTFFGNVEEGARLADSLGKELLVLEGSGAAIPPVASDACLLVVGAGQGAGYVRDYFGPMRLALADAVVVTSAEEPFATDAQVDEIGREILRRTPDTPVSIVGFRPEPLEEVAGRRVFFATTAPAAVLPRLVQHLEREHGCEVVAASTHLSDRARLRDDMTAAAGTYDTLLTELKAAAIEVVAEQGDRIGVPTVLCDNVPVPVSGEDLGGLVERLAALALERAESRGRS